MGEECLLYFTSDDHQRDTHAFTTRNGHKMSSYYGLGKQQLKKTHEERNYPAKIFPLKYSRQSIAPFLFGDFCPWFIHPPHFFAINIINNPVSVCSSRKSSAAVYLMNGKEEGASNQTSPTSTPPT